MFSPNPRSDTFNVIIPDTFFVDSITQKYDDFLKQKPYVLFEGIKAMLIESIQSIELPEFNYEPIIQNSIDPNNAGYDASQASKESVQKLTEKSIDITFRHTDGFMTYFMMLETFFKRYEMGPGSSEFRKPFGHIIFETLLASGSTLCRIYFKDCIISKVPSLALTYATPSRDISTFTCTFKYSEFQTTFISPELKLKPIVIK